jgi:hypothetical protein
MAWLARRSDCEMPHTVNFGRYIEVLRTPGIARLAVFTFLGRLPFAIVGLSVVLLMRREGYG